MVTKDIQTLNLNFDQVMFNCFVFTWERNFKVTFGIFSVLVFQINVLESYLGVCFKISYDQKCENCDNLGVFTKNTPTICLILHQFKMLVTIEIFHSSHLKP